jgi:hypothetical protein
VTPSEDNFGVTRDSNVVTDIIDVLTGEVL